MKFLNAPEVGDTPNYTLPFTDGTNGQVLTTDGAGNVTFATVSTGSVAFDDLTDKTGGTGDYGTTGDFTSGEMALTTNDGYGKSNMTFNHKDGTPQVDGASARITFNTQPTGGLAMQFQMADNVTTGTAVSLTSQMILAEEYLKIREYLSHQGDDNTYVRFTNDRVRIGAGGNVVFDSNDAYDNYESWEFNGVAIETGTHINLPVLYSSGAGTNADPAIYYSTLVGSNGLSFTASTNTIELDADLRDHISYAGSNHDYHRYDIKGQLSSYISSTPSAGGTTSEQMRLVHEDAHFAGDVTAFSSTLSDKRLKDDVKTIENASEKVSQLRGVEYTWNKGSRSGEREIGLIAQEVESVIPSIVKEKKMPLLDGETYKTVDYEKLVALLVEANKEQQDIISQLEERIIDIENRL